MRKLFAATLLLAAALGLSACNAPATSMAYPPATLTADPGGGGGGGGGGSGGY